MSSKATVSARRAAGVCVACAGEANGKYFCPTCTKARNKRRAKTWKLRYVLNPVTYWATRAASRLRRRTAGKAVEVALTPKDILAVFPADRRCPVFGVPFVFGEQSPWSPSIDRRDPAIGYVPGNIQIISVRANQLKSDATADELQQVADWIRGREQHALR